MKNSNEFAAMWRQKIEETIEREFEGVRGLFRRVNVHEWLRRGKLPQFFADSLVEARGEAARINESELTAEDLIAYHNFKRDFVCAATVAPKIVIEDRELQEGEVSYDDLSEHCPTVLDAIFRWTLAGSPDIPVKMNGGETSIEEIDSFREGGEDGTASESSPDLQAVRHVTQPSPRTV